MREINETLCQGSWEFLVAWPLIYDIVYIRAFKLLYILKRKFSNLFEVKWMIIIFFVKYSILSLKRILTVYTGACRNWRAGKLFAQFPRHSPSDPETAVFPIQNFALSNPFTWSIIKKICFISLRKEWYTLD